MVHMEGHSTFLRIGKIEINAIEGRDKCGWSRTSYHSISLADGELVERNVVVDIIYFAKSSFCLESDNEQIAIQALHCTIKQAGRTMGRARSGYGEIWQAQCRTRTPIPTS